jgi:hypothetical protein
MLKTIFAACVAALVLAAPAYADRPSYQDRKDALRFARAYWEDHDRYTQDYGCNPRRIEIFMYRGSGEYGKTYPDLYCAIFLNSNAEWNGDGNRAKWWNTCATVIHEWGHLVGRGHSYNHNSIMAKYGNWNYDSDWYPWFPACRYEGDDPDGDGYPDW